MACGILVPWPGIEPVPPAVEAQSPNRWTAREVPDPLFQSLPHTRSHQWSQGYFRISKNRKNIELRENRYLETCSVSSRPGLHGWLLALPRESWTAIKNSQWMRRYFPWSPAFLRLPSSLLWPPTATPDLAALQICLAHSWKTSASQKKEHPHHRSSTSSSRDWPRATASETQTKYVVLGHYQQEPISLILSMYKNGYQVGVCLSGSHFPNQV